MSFTQFKFKKYIEKALEELKFTTPTEVQEKLIPIVLAGRDLVGESKTGSGKTSSNLINRFQEAHIQGHVGFIDYKGLSLMNSQITRFNQVIDTTWSSNNDMWLVASQFLNLTRLGYGLLGNG